jgi:predicted nucleic-acid-binding Zn-ribbon protein
VVVIFKNSWEKGNNDFEGHTWFMQGGMSSNMIEVEHQRFALELV